VLAHLRASLPEGATLDLLADRGWSGANAVPDDHPLLLAAEAAMHETTGQIPVRVRIGASIPLTELIETALGIDTVMFSYATSDEDYHAPNEFLRLSAIDEGLAGWVAVLRRIGAQDAAEYAPFRR
jgi:acetylornithine deacetylase/succinyl-diaminopimelate desuccinylase-like protein